MGVLSGLSAEELAEKVRLGICDCRVPPYGATDVALFELVRRASERDQAVRERDALEELQPFPVSTVMSWKRRVERADRLAAALERLAQTLDPLDAKIDHALHIGTTDQMRADLAYLRGLLSECLIFACDALAVSQDTPA